MNYLFQNHSFKCIIINGRLASSTTCIIIKDNLPATAYKPSIVEKNKYDKWEKYGLFKAKSSNDKTNSSMVLPPPNVTGKLHLG